MSFRELFTPLQLGEVALPNRIVMAPLTRARATSANVPTPIMAEYYRQRADCGLIVSEAVAVAPSGMGWYRVPGLWSNDMVSGWRHVTSEVHQAGGRIFAQLWHMGRLVLPDYLGGESPMGPSAIAGTGETFAPPGPGYTGGFLPMKPYVVPRAMSQEDIDAVVSAYGTAALNARMAGFDGIEIHAANGYIIDQFLQTASNQRLDGYGGSIENRARLLREIISAIRAHWPSGRIGLRISPTSARKGMGDEDPGALAEYLAMLANSVELAYIHLIEPIADGFMDKPADPVVNRVTGSFQGVVILNGSFDAPSAAAAIASGKAGAVSFGRPFIANPDLVERIRCSAPWAEPNFDFAYVGEHRGYTDYPLLSAQTAAAAEHAGT